VEIIRTAGSAGVLKTALLVAVMAAACACSQQPKIPGYASRTVDPYAAKRWSSLPFTTAHANFADAARHFLNVRPKPQQPIEFPHKIHTGDQIGIECQDCHYGVNKGARAGIPNIDYCMTCHADVGDASDPRIQSLRSYSKRGEDLPWQRVYGFLEESHVRFNHAPHIRAGVGCETCHGDLTQMTVAQRVVDHTMRFCIDCHKQKGASNDCLTCHY
jgi:hypothetical protein